MNKFYRSVRSCFNTGICCDCESLPGQVLHVLLDFCDVNLEVLVALKLRLDRNYIFRVPDLPVMDGLEVFLELVELGAQLLPIRLDTCQALLSICIGCNSELALHFVKLSSLLTSKRRKILCCEARTASGSLRLLLKIFHACSCAREGRLLSSWFTACGYR